MWTDPVESASTRNDRMLPALGTLATDCDVAGASERESDRENDHRPERTLLRARARSIPSNATCFARGGVTGSSPEAAGAVTEARSSDPPSDTGIRDVE